MITLPKLAVMEQEMDRKDFLKYVGVGAVMLLGGNLIVNALNGLGKTHELSQSKSASSGYGSVSYGGR